MSLFNHASPKLDPFPGGDYSTPDDVSSSSSSSLPSSSQQQHKPSPALGVTAAACEWIVALIIIAFVASFVVEFGRIRKEEML